MKGAEKITIPPLFKCPISLDLFNDPVVVCTGQTYDRSSIEKWLEAGNLMCPVTMQKLNDTTLVPNHTLRHLIDRWIHSNNQIEPPPECLELTLDQIIYLVRNKSEGVQVVIRALSGLTLLEPDVENLVREGVAQMLITYIANVERNERSLAPIAMSTIERLLVVESAKKAIVDHPFGVDAIVKMVFRDHEGSESAVNSLMAICSEMKSASEKAVECGVLTQLLLLLQSQCSFGTKTKARMLLKLLGSLQ